MKKERYEELLAELYIYEDKPIRYFMKKYKTDVSDVISAYGELLNRKINGLDLPGLTQIMKVDPRAANREKDRRRYQNGIRSDDARHIMHNRGKSDHCQRR